MRSGLAALLLTATLPGCVIIQVGVTNPIPGLTTVAVAPFFNLSQEPPQVADGRRLALAYYAELQKIPGYQVIPVGVVEEAIEKHDLQLGNPDDALRLCQVLGCDAVVVGAITDYDPYYPPRLGVQVSWYSPYPWDFQPGMPVDPRARSMVRKADLELRKEEHRRRAALRRAKREANGADLEGVPCDDSCEVIEERAGPPPHVIRGQSASLPTAKANTEASVPWPHEPSASGGVPEWWQGDLKTLGPWGPRQSAPSLPSFEVETGGQETATTEANPFLESGAQQAAFEDRSATPSRVTPASAVAAFPTAENAERYIRSERAIRQAAATNETPQRLTQAPETLPPVPPPGLREIPPVTNPLPGPPLFDPRVPLMSYTRLFDGADAALTATLRDYLELRGDLRSGGWEGALHRSDEFQRFCSHLMVLEMLTLHGGEAQKRLVLKFRTYR